MDENANTPAAPSLSKWVGLAVAAVILAEGIWGILVSLTRSLLLPLLARVMGGDPQSPLYLGKGDLNIPDLFGSIVELCLAGIVFLLIKSWAAKADRVKTLRPVRMSRQPAAPVVSIDPQPVAATAQAAAASAVPTALQPSQVAEATPPPQAAPPVPTQATAKPAKPEKPSKPEKSKEVYYNIVGEPINPTEDDQ